MKTTRRVIGGVGMIGRMGWAGGKRAEWELGCFGEVVVDLGGIQCSPSSTTIYAAETADYE